MNINTKIPQESGSFQKLAQFGIQTTGRIVMIGLVGFLVSIWALAELSHGLAGWISRNGK
jgi:hypothetical protein